MATETKTLRKRWSLKAAEDIARLGDVEEKMLQALPVCSVDDVRKMAIEAMKET